MKIYSVINRIYQVEHASTSMSSVFRFIAERLEESIECIEKMYESGGVFENSSVFLVISESELETDYYLKHIEDPLPESEEVFMEQLQNTLNTHLQKTLFELNDNSTRILLKNAVSEYLGEAFDKYGFAAYSVTCTEENNPPAVVDDNNIIVDVAIVAALTAYTTTTRASYK